MYVQVSDGMIPGVYSHLIMIPCPIALNISSNHQRTHLTLSCSFLLYSVLVFLVDCN